MGVCRNRAGARAYGADEPYDRPMNDERTAPPREVAELAEGCVQSVRQVLGVELDYTQDTLPLLDHYLSEVPEDAAEDVLALVGPMAGAYFGEVVRRHLPGARWHAPSGEQQYWRLEFDRCFMHFNPVGMAFEALLGDDVSGWSAHLSVFDQDKERVRDALEVLGEVEAEDYYRLSVRFEVIELAYNTLMADAGAKGRVQRIFGPGVYEAAVRKGED